MLILSYAFLPSVLAPWLPQRISRPSEVEPTVGIMWSVEEADSVFSLPLCPFCLTVRQNRNLTLCPGCQIPSAEYLSSSSISGFSFLAPTRLLAHRGSASHSTSLFSLSKKCLSQWSQIFSKFMMACEVIQCSTLSSAMALLFCRKKKGFIFYFRKANSLSQTRLPSSMGGLNLEGTNRPSHCASIAP